MMIGTNVHDVNLDKFERVKLISDKRRDLDQTTSQIQSEILQCFKRLEDVLKTRERRLIRQVEAVHRQQLSLIQSDMEVLPSLPLLSLNLNSAQELEQQILNFGSVELKGNNLAVNDSEPYKVVDYQEAHKDHINLDKSLQSDDIEAKKKRDICLKTPLKLGFASVTTNTTVVCKNEPTDLDSIDNFSELTEESFRSNDLDTSEDNKKKSNLFEDEHCFISSEDMSPKSKSQELSAANEHPNQIQQWLKQILAETETEPIVQDSDHFTEIAKSQVPLET